MKNLLLYKHSYKILHRHQLSFLEKRITIKFLVGTKFHYGPLNTPNVISYFMATRSSTSLVNIFFLINQIRKTLSLISLNSYHKGMTVISGLSLQHVTLRTRCFYLFSPWYHGFLTNFSTTMRHAMLDKMFSIINDRHIPIDIVNIQRVPQLPTYHLAVQLQHWACNEAASLRIPQTISVDSEIPLSNYSATNILAFNNSTVPSTILILLSRESIISSKLDDKLFFLKNRLQSLYSLPLPLKQKFDSREGKSILIQKFEKKNNYLTKIIRKDINVFPIDILRRFKRKNKKLLKIQLFKTRFNQRKPRFFRHIRLSIFLAKYKFFFQQLQY
jgi:hypothetical protein